MQTEPQRVDPHGSRGRPIGLILLACGLVASRGGIVCAHPSTARRSAEPGSFVAIAGLDLRGGLPALSASIERVGVPTALDRG